MKTNQFWVFMLAIFLAAFSGCKKDSSGLTSNGPSLTLNTTELHWVQNKDLYIQGTATAKDVGLKSIRIQNSDWYLDKTIALDDSIVKSYSLNYKFLVPSDANLSKVYVITVTATDQAGKTATSTINVSLDGDFTAPVINSGPDAALTIVVAPKTENFKASFTVSDNKALSHMIITSGSPLNIKDSIPLTGTSASVVKNYTLPNTLTNYTFNYTLVDKAGLSVTSSTVITVSEMPDFTKMYLADVKTVAELNSDLFGVPMLIDHTAAYTYEAHYYSAVANTQVRFIPQKTDFQPNCFGLDPTDNTTIINDPNSSAIVLPEVGYYKITFNIKTGAYTKVKYTPTDVTPNSMTYDLGGTATPVQIGLVGKGFADHPEQNWSPNTAILLTQDSQNPYIYRVNVTLSGNVQFIIGPQHPWNWWPDPFWRFDSKSNPEYTIKGGGDNVDMTVSTPTKYTFIFDSHLNRAKMVLNQ
ncbi:MAG: hypothetical protein Q8928_07600 [Bacteroidota bacterium]|nr:hypothetical protein [Bacteroidota bacterium]